MTFGAKLKKLMGELNITQTELSNLTGIGKPSICQYLQGKNEPSKERKRDLAKALGVQEDYFEKYDPDVVINQNECFNLSVQMAGKLLGKSTRWVMQGLQDGVFPWGYAVKLSKWSYYISSVKFSECTGIEIPLKEGGGEDESVSTSDIRPSTDRTI